MISIANFTNKKAFLALLIATLLLMVATAAQALGTVSTAQITERVNVSANGAYINVHDGSAQFRMSVSSGSPGSATGSIKQSLVAVGDPIKYERSLKPGQTASAHISLAKSTYYASVQGVLSTAKVVLDNTVY